MPTQLITASAPRKASFTDASSRMLQKTGSTLTYNPIRLDKYRLIGPPNSHPNPPTSLCHAPRDIAPNET
jgi:hypothetical protein